MTEEQCKRITNAIGAHAMWLTVVMLMCTTGIIYAIQWAAK